MDKNKFIAAEKKIQAAKNILIATHNRPDGDALASACALMEHCRQLNKPFSAFCFDPPPSQFNFLPHIEKFISDKARLEFKQFDLIIINDCGAMNRTKLSAEINSRGAGQYIIEFDHHPKIDDYADLEIKYPRISSTCEILYHFFKANNIKINKNIANCLLTGILTDTANFLFPVTGKKTIDAASDLLLAGAKFPLILNQTWRNKSFAAMKIWGDALEGLEINHKYNLAFSVIKYEDEHKNDLINQALEGLPEFLSNLYGIKGLLLLRETEPGIIKGGLRSAHSEIDISLLAQICGGGGHAKSSGFSLAGKISKQNNGWQVGAV